LYDNAEHVRGAPTCSNVTIEKGSVPLPAAGELGPAGYASPARGVTVVLA
jgi:hypothetical protein